MEWQGLRRWMVPANVVALMLIACGVGSSVVLFVSLRVGNSPALIVSDGKAYYAWARSVVIDRDVDFDNDYRALYPPDPLPDEARVLTPIGHVPNKYPVGLALIEAPGVLLGHLIARVVPSVEADGVSWPYQVAIGGGLLALYLCGIGLLFRAMVRLGAAPMWAASFCGMVLAGTNAIHYIAKEPAMAHGAGVAIFSIALYLASGWPDEWSSVSKAERGAFGLLLGLLVLVRNSNAAVLPFLLYAALRERGASLGAVPIIAVSGLVALLQPLSLYLLWGDLRLNTYSGEGFTAGPFGLWSTLFSARHGLFIYHPWYLILVALNCLAVAKTSSITSVLALVSFVGLVFINGSWWCWWFGAGFGNRAFIESVGPLSVGAALFVSAWWHRRSAAWVVGTLAIVVTLLNCDLWLGYLLQRYPHDGEHTIAEAYMWFLERQ